ncbi:hypothetical protein OIU85_008018 [Salix viminalis]|uniref:Uncharacterized protein n=1 Tax=Salix viminalis TaxID=40686 RepID=A0A9Q0P9X4_SALVM|nr:hypothetical protein OIU85_008018 [Salix viminalis]
MSPSLIFSGNNNSKKPENPPPQTAAKGAARDATSSKETFYAVPERIDTGGQREIGRDSAAAASENIYESFLMHRAHAKSKDPTIPARGCSFLACRKEIKPLVL